MIWEAIYSFAWFQVLSLTVRLPFTVCLGILPCHAYFALANMDFANGSMELKI